MIKFVVLQESGTRNKRQSDFDNPFSNYNLEVMDTVQLLIQQRKIRKQDSALSENYRGGIQNQQRAHQTDPLGEDVWNNGNVQRNENDRNGQRNVQRNENDANLWGAEDEEDKRYIVEEPQVRDTNPFNDRSVRYPQSRSD